MKKRLLVVTILNYIAFISMLFIKAMLGIVIFLGVTSVIFTIILCIFAKDYIKNRKKSKNVILFPNSKHIMLYFGENKKSCFTIQYTETWLKEIKHMMKKNSEINIYISNGVYKNNKQYIIPFLKEKLFTNNALEAECFIKEIMCGS